jgi:phosphomannomutase/phosphoglucomutase
MDLKLDLPKMGNISNEKRVHPILIYILGGLGVAMVLISAWLYFSDQNAARSARQAGEQGNAALERVLGPVQNFKQIIGDEQSQKLALAVLDDPAKRDDLQAYLASRIPAVEGVEVYGREELDEMDPDDIGPNGFAVMDMALSVIEGKTSLMQVHGVLQPPRLYDAVALNRDEETVGVMLVAADPSFVTDAFDLDGSELGFVRLAQYNGRQPALGLKEFGNPALAGEFPERIAVPGTAFRVEYPQARLVELFSLRRLVFALVAGFLFILAALSLYRVNARRSAAGPDQVVVVRSPGDALQPAEAEEDAGFAAEPEIEEPRPEAPASPEPAKEEPVAAAPPAMHLHYDIAERRRLKEAEHEPVELKEEIFRAYDIRGVIDKTLDSTVAKQIGQAVGSEVLDRNAGPVVVARDGRLSGPFLIKGMIEGLISTGCDVIDLGAVPTGVLYYAAHEFAKGSAVMITGSHNPPDYNGFKIMIGGDTLHGDAIKGLYQRIVKGKLVTGEGQVERRNVVKDYILRIKEDVKVEKPLRVVLDCGNGIGGVCGPDVLRALGVEVLPLYDEVDGRFPNHHPDPSEPENLQDLIESVRLMDADIGLALDGDADRLGVVTLAGNIIFPDRVLMLFALDTLARVPGATILFDVKCTGHLADVIRDAGGNPVMYKTGHSLMKAKMKEIGAPFAGEMSGHFFFGERWYGVDDGIYAAARLLEILGGTDTPPEAILNALPTSFSTPELKVQMEEGENHAFVEALKDAVVSGAQTGSSFEGAEFNTIDGVRADFDDGWGLVRASNTTPVLVVRFDAESEVALERIKTLFRRKISALNPNLELPF